MCTEGIQSFLDVLIAAVYLSDIVDATGAVGSEGRDEQGDTCTDVRTRHASCTQPFLMVVTNDNGAMRVAEDYLCTHVYQFVNEEQTALEHLLMDEH